MNKITSPVLAPANNLAVYQYKGQLILLDEAFSEAKVLLNNIEGASHLKWSPDGRHIAFILNSQLIVVTIATAKVVKCPLQQISQFEWETEITLYVTANEETLYRWSLQGEIKLFLEQASIEGYSSARQMAVVKRNQKLFAVQISNGEAGELQEVTLQAGNYVQVAFSFTGQYVAYISEVEHKKERHVFVYDFETGITQNLTEMLDVYAGDAMSPQFNSEQGIKEIQWIETDALYFLLSIDGDVRLYYADLYGSLFPASPENEHIMSYSVAQSGNWALYVANEPLLEARLDWFDITTGEGRTIVSEQTSSELDVECFYEMVEIDGFAYYLWGYVPQKCEAAVVVLSGQGRMLGNGYEQRLLCTLNENKAIIYVNHPGALGYGAAYANERLNEDALKEAIAVWLSQKVDQSVVIKEINMFIA